MSLYFAFISELCPRVVIQVSAGFVQMNLYDRLIHTIHHSGAWGVSQRRTRVLLVSTLSISAYFFHRDLQVVHRVNTN